MPREYESPIADEVLKALESAGAMGTAELSTHMGMTKSSIVDSLRRLMKRNRAHIVRFDHQPNGVQGRMIPIYQAGEGDNAEPPKRKTSKMVNAAYRKRHAARLKVKKHIRRGSFESNVWAGLMG